MSETSYAKLLNKKHYSVKDFPLTLRGSNKHQTGTRSPFKLNPLGSSSQRALVGSEKIRRITLPPIQESELKGLPPRFNVPAYHDNSTQPPLLRRQAFKKKIDYRRERLRTLLAKDKITLSQF